MDGMRYDFVFSMRRGAWQDRVKLLIGFRFSMLVVILVFITQLLGSLTRDSDGRGTSIGSVLEIRGVSSITLSAVLKVISGNYHSVFERWLAHRAMKGYLRGLRETNGVAITELFWVPLLGYIVLIFLSVSRFSNAGKVNFTLSVVSVIEVMGSYGWIVSHVKAVMRDGVISYRWVKMRVEGVFGVLDFFRYCDSSVVL